MAVNLTNEGYLETFDSLAISGTNIPWIDSEVLPGWYSNRTTYNAGTGSSNTGSLYSFGMANDGDRALGSVASNATGTIFYGVRLINDTDSTLDSLGIGFFGEQWRNAGNTNEQQLNFAYRIGGGSLTTGDWTRVPDLDFVSPTTHGSARALDGKDELNRAFKSATLNNLVLAAQEEIWLRWEDINDPGNDHGLAIDDLVVSLDPVTPPGEEPGNGEDPIAEPSARIFEIQGEAHRSPLEGQNVVAVPGIVTLVRNNGFYMQDAEGDGNEATSDAIFVFTGSAPAVDIGDEVRVDGTVGEFRPGGQANANLSTTQIGGAGSPGATWEIVSRNNPLPPPVIIGLEGRMPPTGTIAGEAPSGTVEADDYDYAPSQHGIDFFESLEGMRVQVDGGVVVGPTNRFNETWILADNGEGATNRTPRGGVVIGPGDFNPERIQVQYTNGLTPGDVIEASVGDRLSSVVGVIDYSFGNFEVVATEAVAVTPGGLERETTSLVTGGESLTLASYNIENFHPGSPQSQIDGIAGHIAQNLGAPDIIALQEVQDNSGPTNDGVVDATESYQTLVDAIAAAGGPTYKFFDIAPEDGQDGGQPGGNIRVGYLYNPDRVSFIQRPGGTATSNTTVVDGRLSESPGRLQPDDPAFTASRKTLAAEFVFNGQRLFTLNNHFSAKSGSDPLFGRFQPPTNNREDVRAEQARINREFVDDLLAANPNARVSVLGDMNEFQFLPPLEVLETNEAGEQVLFNLTNTLPADQRYSYIFQGNSQSLDHILVSQSLLETAEFEPVHVNAEFFDQVSDHDPLISRFDLTNPTNTLGRSRVVMGTNGDDEIAARGNQFIFGRGGNNIIGPAPDSTGNNEIVGGEGNDLLIARQNDILRGGPGDDYLTAADGLGGNVLNGGPGDDILFAGINDTLNGGPGNDILYAGRGGSVLTGGPGDDQFWVAFNELPEMENIVTDFGQGTNVIGIRNVAGISSFSDLTLTQVGSDTLIQALNTDLARFQNVQADQLSSSQFVFA